MHNVRCAIRILNLNNNSFESLPKEFGNLINLEELYINENHYLKSLPKEFENLTKLKLLDCRKNCCLKKFLFKIKKMNSFEFLDISNTCMENFEWISGTPSLKYLNCSNMNLTNIPDVFTNLINLEKLICNENEIKTIPDFFTKFLKLKYLDLSLNKLLKLENLSLNLEYIICRGNCIFKISSKIGLLTNLKYIDCDFNNLSEIPQEIGNLVNLKYLSFMKNQIKFLPKEIGNLVNLEYLNLGTNKLSVLPKEIENLSKLKAICFCFNEIKEFPNEITNLIDLEKLCINYTYINKIPKSIGNMKNLKIFNFDKNIEEIPREIMNCKKLMLFPRNYEKTKYNEFFAWSLIIYCIGNDLNIKFCETCENNIVQSLRSLFFKIIIKHEKKDVIFEKIADCENFNSIQDILEEIDADLIRDYIMILQMGVVLNSVYSELPKKEKNVFINEYFYKLKSEGRYSKKKYALYFEYDDVHFINVIMRRYLDNKAKISLENTDIFKVFKFYSVEEFKKKCKENLENMNFNKEYIDECINCL